MDGKGVLASSGALDVEFGVVDIEGFDDGGGAGEVAAAARREVFLDGAAADRRNDDAKAVDVHEPDPPAEEEHVDPPTFDAQVVGGAYRREVRRGVATQDEVFGHEARVGEVDEVVVMDGDLAGEDLPEQGLDVAVAKGPVSDEQVDGDGGEEKECDQQGNSPSPMIRRPRGGGGCFADSGRGSDRRRPVDGESSMQAHVRKSAPEALWAADRETVSRQSCELHISPEKSVRCEWGRPRCTGEGYS